MTFKEFYQANTRHSPCTKQFKFGISRQFYPLWKGWHEKNPETLDVLAKNFWYLQYILFLYY